MRMVRSEENINVKEESVVFVAVFVDRCMLQKHHSSELLRLRKMLQYLPAIFDHQQHTGTYQQTRTEISS